MVPDWKLGKGTYHPNVKTSEDFLQEIIGMQLRKEQRGSFQHTSLRLLDYEGYLRSRKYPEPSHTLYVECVIVWGDEGVEGPAVGNEDLQSIWLL